MANPRFAWGIDIGNRALKAIRLSRTADGVSIDDFEVIEHEHVLSEAGDNKEALIQSALANFVQSHGIKGAAVAVGVSGQQSFARFVKLPPVEPKKIPEIVRFEAIQQIPFPLDDVEWSYQLFQNEQSPDVEVGIFAMRKDLVASHVKHFTDAGLNVQVVQMNPLAVYNAMHYDQRIKGTTMFIDLGAENTDLIIAENESIWLRSIPLGGNSFTEALIKQFKLKFAKAEELKRNAATSKYGRQILQAMRPVFADLVSEIQRSIGFYASVHRDSRISQVMALGGTFRLPGLQKYLQQNLQLEVHRVDQLGSSAPQDARLAALFSENILSAVSAYGLALQALGDAKITSSLLPVTIRREKAWREKTKWFALAAACFVVAPIIAASRIYYDTAVQAAAVKAAVPKYDAAYNADKQRSDAWNKAVAGQGEVEVQQIKNVNATLQGHGVMPALWAAIRNAIPAPEPSLIPANIDKIKATPRDQRKYVTLDSAWMTYYPDLSGVMKMKEEDLQRLVPSSKVVAASSSSEGGAPGGYPGSMGGMPGPEGMPPGGGMPGMPPGAGMPPGVGMTPGSATSAAAATQRGYVIFMYCDTPNANGPKVVQQTVLANLGRYIKTPTDKRFAFVKAIVATRMDFSALEKKRKAAQTAYERAKASEGAGSGSPPPMGDPGAFPGGFGPGMSSPQLMPRRSGSGDSLVWADPLTGEDNSKDQEIKIIAVVTLDPAPPPVPAADQTPAPR